MSLQMCTLINKKLNKGHLCILLKTKYFMNILEFPILQFVNKYLIELNLLCFKDYEMKIYYV